MSDVKPDKRAMRRIAISAGVPEDIVDERLAQALPEELEAIEAAGAMWEFCRNLTQPRDPEEYKVDCTELPNGLVVSTMLTTDCGYETAIIDAVCVTPVERYPSIEQAEAGHAVWVKRAAESPETVEGLAWVAMCSEAAGTIRLTYPESNEPEQPNL